MTNLFFPQDFFLDILSKIIQSVNLISLLRIRSPLLSVSTPQVLHLPQVPQLHICLRCFPAFCIILIAPFVFPSVEQLPLNNQFVPVYPIPTSFKVLLGE